GRSGPSTYQCTRSAGGLKQPAPGPEKREPPAGGAGGSERGRTVGTERREVGKADRGVAGGSDVPGPAGWGNPVAAVGGRRPASGRPGPWGNGPRRVQGRAVSPERLSFKADGVPTGGAESER